MWKSGVAALVAVSAVVFVAAASEDPKPATAEPAQKFGIHWEGSVIAARTVKDLDASIRWYQDVLGCAMAYDLRAMGWAELTSPVTNTLVGLGQQEPGKGDVTIGDETLMFGTADILEAQAWLKTKGVRTEPIVEIPQTVKLMTFFDPDGHRMQFHEAWKSDKR